MLRLSHDLRRRILGWAALARPREACGLLVGNRGAGGEALVTRVTSGRNVEARRPERRYVLDALHLLEVESAARASGQDVLGVWHSHPRGAARPSAEDRAGAHGGWSYLIIGLGPGLDRDGDADHGEAPDGLRSWRLSGLELVEEPVLP